MNPTDSELIKDSMLLEYKQALADAHYKIAILNGQSKLKDSRISQLEEQLTEPEPTA